MTVILLANSETYDKTLLKPVTYLAFDIDRPNLENYCTQLFKDGFKNPVITTQIKGTTFKQPKFVFTYDGTPIDDLGLQMEMVKISMKNVLRNVRINQKDSCGIMLQFTEDAIDFLYNQTRHIKQYNFGGVSEQREISGAFKLRSTNKINIDKKLSIFLLDIDKDSIHKGDKESTSYVQSFGTFHTHPYDAYDKHNVCIAWPSADDYLSFYYMYGVCYSGFHVVSTLEGIYLMSLKRYIAPEKVLKRYSKIKDNLEYNHGADYPETDGTKCNIKNGKFTRKKIDRYVRIINNKGKFNLVFVTWDELRKGPIRLRYAPVGQTCLLSNEQATRLREMMLATTLT
jgi:hypothetical protein